MALLTEHEQRQVSEAIARVEKTTDAELVTVLAALYIVSPIDFVPDTIPILGWLDDGLIGFLLLQLAFRFLPAGLLASLRERVGTKLG